MYHFSTTFRRINMAKTGVFKNEHGDWSYRFSLVIDGQRVSRRKSTDEHGNKLHTKGEASRAKERAIELLRNERKQKKRIKRKTVQEVFAEYCEQGRSDRAYQTIRKQDSLWENHLKSRFGSRFVDEISVAEVNDYLAELYYKDGLSYRYVESFLKMFYLFFGQAFSRNYLDSDNYCKLCKNKDTKIHMPKMKDEDDTDIVAFSRDQLALLDEYFKGTNAETAYLLGRYCGLRINECFGLKWDHVDLDNGTIYIDRQMQYQEGLIKLVPVKTRNGKRTVYLCEKLRQHLRERFFQKAEDEKKLAAIREQKQRVIEDLGGGKMLSTELVNCLPNGTIQTVNSFKYPTRDIKATLGISFKYHYLRHTYGTMMAELNTPQHLLCSQMGHGNIHITQRYYLALTKTGVDVLHDKLNQL